MVPPPQLPVIVMGVLNLMVGGSPTVTLTPFSVLPAAFGLVIVIDQIAVWPACIVSTAGEDIPSNASIIVGGFRAAITWKDGIRLKDSEMISNALMPYRISK